MPGRRAHLLATGEGGRFPLTCRRLGPATAAICLTLLATHCSAIQHLHGHYRFAGGQNTTPSPQAPSPVTTASTEKADKNVLNAHGAPGLLLVQFQNDDLRGSILFGRSLRGQQDTICRVVDAFAVEVQVTNLSMRPVPFRPADFRIEKAGVRMAPLLPSDLMRSYRTTSTARGCPFELRSVPNRPGLLVEPPPPWAMEPRIDTPSSTQQQLRNTQRGQALNDRFQMEIGPGESAAVVLFFPLLPPDNRQHYRLMYVATGPGKAGKQGAPIPIIPFDFQTDTTEEDPPLADLQAFDRAFSAHRKSMFVDRMEIYDIHAQLQQHGDAAMKRLQAGAEPGEPSPPVNDRPTRPAPPEKGEAQQKDRSKERP